MSIEKILKCRACYKIEKFGWWIYLNKEEWRELERKIGWEWDWTVCPECVVKNNVKKQRI